MDVQKNWSNYHRKAAFLLDLNILNLGLSKIFQFSAPPGDRIEKNGNTKINTFRIIFLQGKFIEF
jgi:hypothetical protein